MMRYVLLAVVVLMLGTAGYTARCLNRGRRGRALAALLGCAAALALGYFALGWLITSM